MAPASTLVLGSITNPEGLKTCSPYLMPFHIKYSGQAPISTFLRVNAAKETVGAPPTPEKGSEEGPSNVEVNEAGPSNSPRETVAPAAAADNAMDTDVKDAPVAAAPPTLVGRVTDATTRFISTFRGRTIQGLKVPLPEGYVGVVLRTEGATNGKSRQTTGSAKDRTKTTNQNGKKKATRTKGRATRSMTRGEEGKAVEELIDAVDDPMDVNHDGELHSGNQVRLDEEEVRTLAVSSQFSSFVLWHADHPVDEKRDDYVRSLTEWTRLAHVIHQVED
ncbi:ribonuclease H2, subunit C [Lyophyllum atratum]|nr:ribonuclease H2, subunit C [Lyophyllum atratum]